MKLADIRNDYRRGRLRRENLREDPIEQFQVWLNEACSAGLTEPTAVSLATSSKDGRCLVRTVLPKGLDERGFVFFYQFREPQGTPYSGESKRIAAFSLVATGTSSCGDRPSRENFDR